jgi:serine/threonine protein kinase
MSCSRCTETANHKCKYCGAFFCGRPCYTEDGSNHGLQVCGKPDPPSVVGPDFWAHLCEKKNRYQTFNRTAFDKLFKWDVKLGKGGFGIVYKVQEKKTSKFYALKLLYNPDQDFDKELDVHCEISKYNPNILQYYGAFKIEYEGKLLQALLMEYIDGIALESILENPKELAFWNVLKAKPTDVRVKVTLTVMNGLLNDLVPLHRHKIAHRDIKAGNIIVTFVAGKPQTYSFMSGAVLIDYGMACKMTGDSKTDGEGCDRWGGTLLLTPPEILTLHTQGWSAPPPGLDFCAADIWASGMILWELLIGENPLEKALTAAKKRHTLAELNLIIPIAVKALQEDKEFLSNRGQLRDILLSMLQINPERRITAAELHKAYPDLLVLTLEAK